MPVLIDNPTLSDFQKYVTELEKERGFIKQTVVEKCLLLGEEIGELFKAIRKSERILLDANSKTGEVDSELADIFIYVCAIANRMNINLEKAFREKEKINHLRKWE